MVVVDDDFFYFLFCVIYVSDLYMCVILRRKAKKRKKEFDNAITLKIIFPKFIENKIKHMLSSKYDWVIS